MLIGYARVSISDQRLDLQQDALRGAGCERIFTDSVSGAKTERLGLTAALDACRAGDILVIWKRKAAVALKRDPQYSIREICEIVGISRNTYYKYTRE